MIGDPAFHKALGATIRKRRFEKGLTMEILADHLGVSHQQVQKWETGINRISALNLSQIASRLNCSANDLLGEAGAPGIASTQEGRLFPEGSSPEDGRLFLEAVRALRCLNRKHLQAVHSLIKALADEEA